MVSLQVFLSFLPRVPCLPNSPFPFKRLPWRLFQVPSFFFQNGGKSTLFDKKIPYFMQMKQE